MENSVGSCRFQNFFRLWTLKEAALKSVGEGMPFGLEAFHFELTPRPAVVKVPREYGGPERFAAHAVEGTDGLVSVVTRSRS